MAAAKTRIPADTLAPGDRVRERDRLGLDVARVGTPAFEKVSHYRHHPRRGRITNLVVKADRRGGRVTYAEVLWDGLATPSLHATWRLLRLNPEDA